MITENIPIQCGLSEQFYVGVGMLLGTIITVIVYWLKARGSK